MLELEKQLENVRKGKVAFSVYIEILVKLSMNYVKISEIIQRKLTS